MEAAVLTIGNELVSGDVPNTNASWLAKRLEALGVHVVLTAALPDEIPKIADFVRRERENVDHLLVTGGLGGTPDDLTREAMAEAFSVGQVAVSDLAADLRARFPGRESYAARWADLPEGSRPLENPRGGAPGFHLGNVWVFPGLPSEMEAMFDRYAEEFRTDRPIKSWRRAFRVGESQIATLLEAATRRWTAVQVGSYPRFDDLGPEVEIVLKSDDAAALAEAVAWLEPQIEAI